MLMTLSEHLGNTGKVPNDTANLSEVTNASPENPLQLLSKAVS